MGKKGSLARPENDQFDQVFMQNGLVLRPPFYDFTENKERDF